MKNLVIDLDYTICRPYENEDQQENPVLKYSQAEPLVEIIEKIREYKKKWLSYYHSYQSQHENI